MNFDAFARFYDGDYRNYTVDLPLILEIASAAGGRALELGCGTGRVLVPLAQAGCRATGVDGSPELLSLARRKAELHGVEAAITLVQDDMRTVSLVDGAFDSAFVVSNTLMHLPTQADQLAALKIAYQALRPGGLLFIDLFNPDIPYLVSIAGVQELADQWEDEERGTVVFKWTTRFVDVARQVQDTVFVYEEVFADGRSEQTTLSFPMRFWWPSEGALLLEKAGFAVEALWGDFDRGPYNDESESLIFLARKAG